MDAVGSNEGAYSIRVVASQTGIPADTLRVWERRYGFPKPDRRPGGGRLYAPADVARLRLIARARSAGFRPGDVIALPDGEIARLLEGGAGTPAAPARAGTATTAAPAGAAATITAAPGSDVPEAAASRTESTVETLIEHLMREDVDRLRSALRSLAIALGPKAFVTDVAHPLAVRVGDAWESGDLAIRHEHLATALLSARLHVLSVAFEDSLVPPVVLLATLPGEAHVLGLEMVRVYLGARGATPRHLGGDTPPEEIARAARALGADVVGISVSAAHEPASTRRAVEQLRRALADTEIELWIGGAGAGAAGVAKPDERVRVTTGWNDIERALAAVRGRLTGRRPASA
ncbi:MAG: MerR family transcriptional regulator [Labilithrix sp.]|nr:MerR family transcriptional regulator [Labilithrix sp.]